MICPSYHVSELTIRLVSEISEQVGILETLTGKMPVTTNQDGELPFDPLSENDLLRAQVKMVDELSTGKGYYREDDQRIRLHMAMLFD